MRTPPPRDDLQFSNTTGIEVEQETSAPPPKKNPGYPPESSVWFTLGSEDETVFCDT